MRVVHRLVDRLWYLKKWSWAAMHRKHRISGSGPGFYHTLLILALLRKRQLDLLGPVVLCILPHTIASCLEQGWWLKMSYSGWTLKENAKLQHRQNSQIQKQKTVCTASAGQLRPNKILLFWDQTRNLSYLDNHSRKRHNCQTDVVRFMVRKCEHLPPSWRNSAYDDLCI